MTRLAPGLLVALALATLGSARAQEASPSAYQALSPGNQMIVDSIHGSLVPGSTLTKDEIAAMKDGTGWGNAYKQLHADGRVTERNLGQAMRQHLDGDTASTGTAPATSGGTETAPVAATQGKAHVARGRGAASTRGGEITMTTGAGTTVAAGKNAAVSARGGAAAGAHGGSGGGSGTQNPAGITRGAGGNGYGHGGGRGR